MLIKTDNIETYQEDNKTVTKIYYSLELNNKILTGDPFIVESYNGVDGEPGKDATLEYNNLSVDYRDNKLYLTIEINGKEHTSDGVEIIGLQGEEGIGIDHIYVDSYNSNNQYTYTNLNISKSDNTIDRVQIKALNGVRGEKGDKGESGSLFIGLNDKGEPYNLDTIYLQFRGLKVKNISSSTIYMRCDDHVSLGAGETTDISEYINKNIQFWIPDNQMVFISQGIDQTHAAAQIINLGQTGSKGDKGDPGATIDYINVEEYWEDNGYTYNNIKWVMTNGFEDSIDIKSKNGKDGDYLISVEVIS